MKVVIKGSFISSIGQFLIMSILLSACTFTITFPRNQQSIPSLPDESISSAITILNTSSYDDGYGTFYVIGELRNDGVAALQNIQLRITIHDSGGKSILMDPFSNISESELFSPYLDMLFPGQVSGFEYSLAAQAGTPANYTVDFVTAVASMAVRGNIRVENAQFLNDPYGFSYIVGELVNLEDFPIRLGGLAGGVLDADGKPISSSKTLHMVEYLDPAGYGAGRDRAPFMISMYGSYALDTPWKIYVNAIKENLLPSAPVALQVTNEYRDTYGYYHVIGTAQNLGDEQLSFLIQGGLYESNGKVLDANYYELPINLDPGAVQPFDMFYWDLVNRNAELQTRIGGHTVQIDPGLVKTTSRMHFTLNVSEFSESKEDNGIWRFHGRVKNDSGKPLTYEVVFISIIDSQGRLVATSQQTVFPEDHVIPVGSEKVFDIEVDLDPSVDLTGFQYRIAIVGEAME